MQLIWASNISDLTNFKEQTLDTATGRGWRGGMASYLHATHSAAAWKRLVLKSISDPSL